MLRKRDHKKRGKASDVQKTTFVTDTRGHGCQRQSAVRLDWVISDLGASATIQIDTHWASSQERTYLSSTSTEGNTMDLWSSAGDNQRWSIECEVGGTLEQQAPWNKGCRPWCNNDKRHTWRIKCASTYKSIAASANSACRSGSQRSWSARL